MHSNFFHAKNYMNEILVNPRYRGISFERIFSDIPNDLKGYFMQHDITRRIYRCIFQRINQQSIDFYHTTNHLYFHDHKDLLSISHSEMEEIEYYTLIHSKNDEAVYYSIFFLACFGFTTPRKASLKPSVFKVIRSLYQYFSSKSRIDDFRIVMNMIQKLPWYTQQFRVLRSPELCDIYKGLLQAEINFNVGRILSIHGQFNTICAWDNLTSEIEIFSRKMRPYSPGHIYYTWQFLIECIAQIEKAKSVGTYLDKAYRLFLEQQLPKDTGLCERIGIDQLKQLLKEIANASDILKFLYKKEYQVYIDLSNQSEKDLAYFYLMTSCSIYPSYYDIKETLKDLYIDLKNIAKDKKIVSLSAIVPNYDPETSRKLVSTVFYLKDNSIEFYNCTTPLSDEDFNSIQKTVEDIDTCVTDKIILHYASLYKDALATGKKNLVWIGTEITKFFPIHILPGDVSNSTTWIEKFDSIEFANSIRELTLPKKERFYTENYPAKKSIPIVRCFGEEKDNPNYPKLGKKVLLNLQEIDSSPIIIGTPVSVEDVFHRGEERLDFIPTVASYYGHIHSGNYLEDLTGFFAEGKYSSLNLMVGSAEFNAAKRVELWGCNSATLFTFNSEELTRYEHFAERFIASGVEQILVTLKEVPDFAASLIWEYISLNEKAYPEKVYSSLLRNTILWYRDSISKLSETIQEKIYEWLQKQINISSKNIEKELHPSIRRIITKETNNLRLEYRKNLTESFALVEFSEEEIDQSLLNYGEACYLGKKKNKEYPLYIQDPGLYVETFANNTFFMLKSSTVWGAFIFIKTTSSSWD